MLQIPSTIGPNEVKVSVNPKASKSIGRIEVSLLGLMQGQPLERISVTALCNKANVSRSTFYAHFSNVEEVYRNLLINLFLDARSLTSQMHCSDFGHDDKHKPLCIAIREDERYKSLVDAKQFTPTLYSIYRSEFGSNPSIYSELGLDEETAFNLLFFQLISCVTAATHARSDKEWERTQRAIDDFIRGGINGVRSNSR